MYEKGSDVLRRARGHCSLQPKIAREHRPAVVNFCKQFGLTDELHIHLLLQQRQRIQNVVLKHGVVSLASHHAWNLPTASRPND